MNRRSVAIVLAIWFAGLGAAAQFAKISVLYPFLAAHYGAESAIAFMVSLVGAAGLVFGTTAGLLSQGLGYRRVIVVALLTSAAISSLQALLPPLSVMLVSRVVEGFAHLAIVVAGPVLIAQAGGVKHQGLVMTLWASFFGVSFAILGWLGPVLQQVWGLPSMFWGHAGFMAMMALLLWRLLPVEASSDKQAVFRGLLGRHLAIYASPVIAAPAMGFVFYTLTYVALLTLLPQMFPAGSRPMVATAMPLFSIAVSMTLGVWMLRVMSAVRLVQFGFALAMLAAIMLWGFYENEKAFVVFALVLFAGLGLVQGASFNVIPQLNETAAERAQAAGALAQLGNLGTTSGTPILAAMIGLWGITGLLVFVAPLCLAGIAVHGWLRWRRSRAV